MLIAYEPGSTQAELRCSIPRKRVTAKGGGQKLCTKSAESALKCEQVKKRKKAERRFRDMLDDK